MTCLAIDARSAGASPSLPRVLNRLCALSAALAAGLLLAAGTLSMIDGVVANAIQGLTLVLGSA